MALSAFHLHRYLSIVSWIVFKTKIILNLITNSRSKNMLKNTLTVNYCGITLLLIQAKFSKDNQTPKEAFNETMMKQHQAAFCIVHSNLPYLLTLSHACILTIPSPPPHPDRFFILARTRKSFTCQNLLFFNFFQTWFF